MWISISVGRASALARVYLKKLFTYMNMLLSLQNLHFALCGVADIRDIEHHVAAIFVCSCCK